MVPRRWAMITGPMDAGIDGRSRGHHLLLGHELAAKFWPTAWANPVLIDGRDAGPLLAHRADHLIGPRTVAHPRYRHV